MRNSKDVGRVIFMAVLAVVSSAFIVQIATLISGIQGANYIFTIIMALQTSFSLLLYQGRKWRLLAQNAILTLLIMPLYLGGTPFSITKIHLIPTAFVVDLLFNSFYKTFRDWSKLRLWSILCTLMFYLIMPFFSLLIRTLFYSPEAVALYVNVILLLSPVIIIEAIAGGYLGHQIYLRLKKTGYA
jgi:hypothetical protein